MFETFFVFLILLLIVLALRSSARAKEETQLLERSPESWKALQEEKEQKKQRKRATLRKAAVGGFKLARWFLKK